MNSCRGRAREGHGLWPRQRRWNAATRRSEPRLPAPCARLVQNALGTESQSQCVPLGSGPDLCRRRACARLQVSVDQLMAGSLLNPEYVSLSALTGSFLRYYGMLCARVHMSVCSVVMLVLRCGDICSWCSGHTDCWVLSGLSSAPCPQHKVINTPPNLNSRLFF